MATYRAVVKGGGRETKSKGFEAESAELFAGQVIRAIERDEELVRVERREGRRWIDCNVMPATKE